MLTSLIIFSGFIFVLGVGALKVIRDLSEMSVHVAPDAPATPHGVNAAETPRTPEKIARPGRGAAGIDARG